MKISKLLAIAMVLCVVVTSFAGCGSAATPENTASPSSSAAAPAESTTDSAATTAEQQDVSLICAFNMADKERYTKFFDAFEAKYPYIHTELLGLEASFNNYYTTCMASNSMPDVFNVNADAFGRTMANDGWMLDLKGTQAESLLSPSMVTAFTADNGVFYGIPYGMATTVLFYNKKIFADAGVTPPTNWDEFLDVCSKLKAKGITPFSMMMGDISIVNNNFTSGFVNNIVTTDTNWSKEVADGTFDFTQPGIVDIFDRTKLLIDKGYVQDGFTSAKFQDALDVFSMGDAAMVLAGAWFAGNIAQNADFEYGTIIPPWNKKGEPQAVAISPETGWGGSAKNGKDDAIRKVLEFFVGEGYTILQNASGTIPVVKDTTGCKVDPSINEILPNILGTKFIGQMQYSFLPFAMRVEIPKVFQDLAAGNLTSAQAAAAIQANYKAAKEAEAAEVKK